MIRGAVNARHEAMVSLRVRGPGGVTADVDVIVDSGFNASLTLPVAMASALSLPRLTAGTAVLADGSVRQFDICDAEIEWDGAWRTVLVYAVGNQPLLGMRLLTRHKLTIDVEPGGLVEIIPLP